MSRKLCLLALLAAGLTSTASATRVLEQRESAYEAALEHVTLPGSAAGHVIFRTCGTCPTRSMRVTPDTRYVYERTALPFADFLLAAEEAQQQTGPDEAAVYVFYDAETERVNRLIVDRFDE